MSGSLFNVEGQGEYDCTKITPPPSFGVGVRSLDILVVKFSPIVNL